MNVKMVGWYGHNNIGDESYKLSFPKLFPNLTFDFSEDNNKEYDWCFLGGGNILSEKYVTSFCNIKAKKKAIFSVSVDNNSKIDLLPKVDYFLVRDLCSLDDNRILCPDFAWSLEPSPENGYKLIKTLFRDKELYTKVVCVVYNAYLFPGRSDVLARDMITFQKVSQELVKTIDSTPASFLFLPMSTGFPHDDRVTNGYLMASCKFWRKNCMVYDKLSVQETLDVISACDLLISTRLHSTIFGCLGNVPFLDIVHHDKNRCLLQTIGMEKFGVSYWSFDGNLFFDKVSDMLTSKKLYSDVVSSVRQSQVKNVKEVIANVYID